MELFIFYISLIGVFLISGIVIFFLRNKKEYLKVILRIIVLVIIYIGTLIIYDYLLDKNSFKPVIELITLLLLIIIFSFVGIRKYHYKIKALSNCKQQLEENLESKRKDFDYLFSFITEEIDKYLQVTEDEANKVDIALDEIRNTFHSLYLIAENDDKDKNETKKKKSEPATISIKLLNLCTHLIKVLKALLKK